MGERTDVGTIEDMQASATKLCGLDDFGVDDDNYREARAGADPPAEFQNRLPPAASGPELFRPRSSLSRQTIKTLTTDEHGSTRINPDGASELNAMK